ncbi:hypothetical protein [Nesterenkonia pannonica]|uniref:hypothetical protein n=1 Tax=Nesterenkonia pannonica TaxID=1548602 RepID=UPI00216418D2|nr:hypothetical protein [Nesterenkonia pannonica]
MIYFRPGDIVKFTPVTEEEYRTMQKQVAAGTFAYRTLPVEFDAEASQADPEGYNQRLLETLA